MNLVNRLAFLFYLLVLAWAPLPLGSNRPWAWIVLELLVCGLALFCLLAWLFQPALFSTTALRSRRLILWLFALHLLLLAGQMLPLPPGLLAALSPAKAVWFAGGPGEETGGSAVLTASTSDSLNAFFKQQTYVLFLGLTLVLLDSSKRLFTTIAVLVAVALAEVVYGTSAHMMGEGFGLWRPTWLGHDWVTGTFVNKNHFAALLSFAIALVIGLLLYLHSTAAPEPRSRHWYEVFSKLVGALLSPRMLLPGLLLVLLSGLFLSESRGALLALVLATLLLLGYGMLCHGRSSAEGRVLPYLLGSGLVAVLWLGTTGIFVRLLQAFSTEDFRLTVWRQSLPLLREHWLTGVGNGAYELAFTRYKTPELAARVVDFAHNDHLQLLVEQGIVIGGLWYAALLACTVKMLRAYRAHQNGAALQGLLAGVMIGCLAFFLHGLVDFNFHIPANALWFYTLMGMGLVLSRPLKSIGSPERG